MDDWDLLQEYAKTGSEAAFTELVQRHIDWVYSVALRQVREPQVAEDVAQSAFALLANKGRGLRPGTRIGGWLFRSTCFLAKCALRAERRRRVREEAAAIMIARDADTEARLWDDVSPLLEQAVTALPNSDREAVLLRFYEKKSLSDVGSRLGITEEAAKKRVSRAVEKLRVWFSKRGVTLGSFALAGLLAERVVHAAPGDLTASAVASSTQCSGTLPQLAREAMRGSTRTGIKVAVSCACAVLLIGLTSHRVATGRWVPFQAAMGNEGSGRVEAAGDMKTGNVGENRLTGTATRKPGFLFRVVAASDNRGIEGARVLVNQVTGMEWIQGKELRTDAEGYCTVPLESGMGRLDVGALKDGFVQRFYTWRIDSGDPLPPYYVLKLGRAATIGGHVQDTAGKPVADAEIGLSFHGISDSTATEPPTERFGFIGGGVTVTRTDTEGNWHCALTPRDFDGFSVTAKGSGFVEKSFVVHPTWEKAISLAALQAGKAVMVLEKGYDVRGYVLDELGNPLPGARVSWMNGMNYRQDGVTSDTNGVFTMPGLPAGPTQLSAWAKGFAAQLLPASVGPSTPELVFRLNRGVSVPIRIVDENGDGVAGAWAVLDLPLPHNSDLSVKTDASGRAAFTGIPTNAVTSLTCHAGAKGYFCARDIRLVAAEPEAVVRLTKSLQVSGDVVDSEIGIPIATFKAIPCYGEEAGGYDRSQTRRGQFGMYTIEFSELRGPLRVRIEAEGYEPAMSDPLPPGPPEQRQDFRLHKKDESRAIRGQVLTRDGEPVANVVVALLTFEQGATLYRGNFSPRDGAILATTDERGEFKFEANPQAHTLVAADRSLGFARLRVHRATGPFKLQLQPWGKIEGRVVLGGQAAPNREVGVSPGFMGYRSVREGLYAADQRTTDEEGRFTFELMPPGDYTLNLSEGRGQPLSHSTPVVVKTGETATVQIGGTGVRVTGKLRMKDGSKVDWPRQLIFASVATNLKAPAAKPPPDSHELAGKLKMMDFFDQSEEWRAYEMSMGSFPLEVASDGSFVVEDISPGPYRLSVRLSDSASENGDMLARMRRNSIASLRAEVVVPATTAEQQTIDLGSFELAPSAK